MRMRFVLFALLVILSVVSVQAQDLPECDFTLNPDSPGVGQVIYGSVIGNGFIGNNYADDVAFIVTDFPFKLRIQLRDGSIVERESAVAYYNADEPEIASYVVIYQGYALEWSFTDAIDNWLPFWSRWNGWEFCEIS